MKAYTALNPTGSDWVMFETIEGKGCFFYRFNLDSDIDDDIQFVIQTADGSTTLFQGSCEIIRNVDRRMRINIDGDTKEVTVGEPID